MKLHIEKSSNSSKRKTLITKSISRLRFINVELGLDNKIDIKISHPCGSIKTRASLSKNLYSQFAEFKWRQILGSLIHILSKRYTSSKKETLIEAILQLVFIIIERGYDVTRINYILPKISLKSSITDGENFFDFAFFDLDKPFTLKKSSKIILENIGYSPKYTKTFTKKIDSIKLGCSFDINLLSDDEIKEVNIALVEKRLLWQELKAKLPKTWFEFFKYTYSNIVDEELKVLNNSKISKEFKNYIYKIGNEVIYQNSILPKLKEDLPPKILLHINPLQIGRNEITISKTMKWFSKNNQQLRLISPSKILQKTKREISLSPLWKKSRILYPRFHVLSKITSFFEYIADFLLEEKSVPKADPVVVLAIYFVAVGIRNSIFEAFHIANLSLDVLGLWGIRNHMVRRLNDLDEFINFLDTSPEINRYELLRKLLVIYAPGWNGLPEEYDYFNINNYWEIIDSTDTPYMKITGTSSEIINN